MPFVGAAYRCVKPGGMLVLSVPNQARRKDLSFGSLDYPPTTCLDGLRISFQ